MYNSKIANSLENESAREIVVLIAYGYSHSLNVCTQLSSGTRGIHLDKSKTYGSELPVSM